MPGPLVLAGAVACRARFPLGLSAVSVLGVARDCWCRQHSPIRTSLITPGELLMI